VYSLGPPTHDFLTGKHFREVIDIIKYCFFIVLDSDSDLDFSTISDKWLQYEVNRCLWELFRQVAVYLNIIASHSNEARY
jgi:hypothetical protein